MVNCIIVTQLLCARDGAYPTSKSLFSNSVLYCLSKEYTFLRKTTTNKPVTILTFYTLLESHISRCLSKNLISIEFPIGMKSLISYKQYSKSLLVSSDCLSDRGEDTWTPDGSGRNSLK